MADQLTLEQFGQKIKATHPDYKDMSDLDVGTKVLAKFPQYRDMVSQQDQMRASVSTAKQNMARQGPALDKFQNDNSFGSALATRAKNEAMNAPGAALSDLGDTALAVGKTLLPSIPSGPPQSMAEGADQVMEANPLAAAPYKMAKGYFNATQQNLKESRDAATRGDSPESIIKGASAGLPLVGPLIGGVYDAAKNEQGLGTGISRTAQLMAMAPEGSPIRAPLNAAGGVLGKATGYVANKAGLTPEAMMRPVLNAAPKAFRFGKDPVAFVVDNKIGGASYAEVADNVGQTLQPKILQLNRVLADSKASIDLQPTADMLQSAIDQANRARNAPLASQLQKLYDDRFGGKQPMKVAAQDAAAIKRGIQDSIDWMGEGNAISKIKMQLQHQLGSDIHDAVPGSAALDEEVSNGIEAHKAAIAQDLREQAGKPTGPTKFGQWARTATGAAVGTAVAGPVGGMVGAVAYPLAKYALSKPGVRTAAAGVMTGARDAAPSAGVAKATAVAGAASRGNASNSGTTAAIPQTAVPTAGKPVDKATAVRYLKEAGAGDVAQQYRSMGPLQKLSNAASLKARMDEIQRRAMAKAKADGYDTSNLQFDPSTISADDF